MTWENYKKCLRINARKRVYMEKVKKRDKDLENKLSS